MSMSVVALVSRWLHILSAIAAVGGTIFIRFVFLPAAISVLDPEKLKALRQVLMNRWRKIVHSCVGLLLITGFINFMYAMKTHPNPLYHSIFGIKFLLALVVFYFAIMLSLGREID